MIGWVGDIERLTLHNDTFRTVLFTGAHTQLTVMRLAPGEDIGKEVHPDRDQFIRIEEGQARVEFGRDEDGVDESHDFSDDWAVTVVLESSLVLADVDRIMCEHIDHRLSHERGQPQRRA